MDEDIRREFDKLDRENRNIHKRISEHGKDIDNGFKEVREGQAEVTKPLLKMAPHIEVMANQVSTNEKTCIRLEKDFKSSHKELKEAVSDDVGDQDKVIDKQTTKIDKWENRLWAIVLAIITLALGLYFK